MAARSSQPKRQPRCRVVPLLLGSLGLLAASLRLSPRGGAFTSAARLQPLQRAGSSARFAAASGDLKVTGTVEPLGSHLLVKIFEVDELTKGGILLPKQEKPKGGEVVAVGPGETDPDTGALVPMHPKPGQKVLYSRYSGSRTLDVEGADHTLLREDDVLVLYEGEAATLDTLTMPRGRVLMKLADGVEETSSGLLLSSGAVERSTTVGEVIAVGPGEVDANGQAYDPPVKVGDMVRFRYGDEVELDIGDARYSAVKMSACIARWKAA